MPRQAHTRQGIRLSHVLNRLPAATSSHRAAFGSIPRTGEAGSGRSRSGQVLRLPLRPVPKSGHRPLFRQLPLRIVPRHERRLPAAGYLHLHWNFRSAPAQTRRVLSAMHARASGADALPAGLRPLSSYPLSPLLPCRSMIPYGTTFAFFNLCIVPALTPIRSAGVAADDVPRRVGGFSEWPLFRAAGERVIRAGRRRRTGRGFAGRSEPGGNLLERVQACHGLIRFLRHRRHSETHAFQPHPCPC